MRFAVLLCICWLSLIGHVQAQAQPTLYAVLVGAVDDRSLARPCQLDMVTMDSQLHKIADDIDYQYKAEVLTKDRFHNNSINTALASLHCNPEDIIVFYYTGHGYNTAQYTGDFPFLMVDPAGVENLPLMQIHEELLKKKARFCLTIGDCCNKVDNEELPKTRSFVKGTQCNSGIYRQLFLQTRGGVITTSSKRGQVSGASTGGSFYTWSLLQSLDYACHYNEEITWQQLLDDTQTRLGTLTAAKVRKQESIYQVNAESAVDSTTEVVTLDNQTPLDTTANSTIAGPAVVQTPVVQTPAVAVAEPPAPASQPEQRPSFSVVNGYLNALTDETLPYAARKAQQAKAGQFFVHNAKIKVYVNDTPVALMPLEQLMNRYSLLAKKIVQVNVVERLSKLDPSGRYYTELAVQELWNP